MCWTHWGTAKEQEEECGGEEEGKGTERDETGRIVPVMIILAPVGTFGWDGKQDAILCSIHVCSSLGLCSLVHIHTLIFRFTQNTHWQSEAGACGSSPVTAACSQGGDASGAAPCIGEACLCWPWINNFSFSAEMTGIVIKEMEWFYWPWCLY